MAITFGGLSSGLPPNLVEQLIEAERIPIQNLEGRKAKQENRLMLVNELEEKINKVRSSLETLASQKGFSDIVLESGDKNIVNGTVDPEAAKTGNFNIEVIQLAQKASAITNGFADRDVTEVGVGYISFDTPDGEKEVYINGDNNTLDGVANAVNNAKLGIRATVINDRKDPDEPFKLMFAGEAVGGDNRIEYPTLYFLDGDQDLYFDEEREAENGVIKVDGFEFEIGDNQVEDIIPGVTLDLRQSAPGRIVNINVKENREKVSGKIDEFVTSMNDVLGFIQNQNRLTEDSDTSATLGGDGMIRSLEQRIRRLVQGMQVGVGSIKRLNQMGVEFNRQGTLKANKEKFNNILASNPDAIRQFFVGDGFNTGFISSLKRTINLVTNPTNGSIALRKKSLQNNIRRMDDQIESKERQLGKKEQALRRKFANLEETMSRLKAQGGAVASMGGGGFQGPNLGGGIVS